MARESEKAARLAEAEGLLRSSASRYYYAAYQATTALLLYRGLMPSTDHEAWSHALTPVLLKEQTEFLIRSRSRRADLANRLAGLYTLRISADYVASDSMAPDQVRAAGRDAGYILSVIDGLLPQR